MAYHFAPSLLAAGFARLGDEAREVIAATIAAMRARPAAA